MRLLLYCATVVQLLLSKFPRANGYPDIWDYDVSQGDLKNLDSQETYDNLIDGNDFDGVSDIQISEWQTSYPGSSFLFRRALGPYRLAGTNLNPQIPRPLRRQRKVTPPVHHLQSATEDSVGSGLHELPLELPSQNDGHSHRSFDWSETTGDEKIREAIAGKNLPDGKYGKAAL